MPTAAEAAYIKRTPRSAELFSAASDIFPGGVAGNINFFSPYPPTMKHATGAYLWDVDGNRYRDFLLAWGTLILGHGHPAIGQAISSQLAEDGTALFGAPHHREVALAQALMRHFPSAEKLRFTNSGLEATLLALRLAVAHTGRTRIAKFEGHYHGAHDRVLVSYAPSLAQAGPAERPRGVSGFPRHPAAHRG